METCSSRMDNNRCNAMDPTVVVEGVDLIFVYQVGSH